MISGESIQQEERNLRFHILGSTDREKTDYSEEIYLLQNFLNNPKLNHTRLIRRMQSERRI